MKIVVESFLATVDFLVFLFGSGHRSGEVSWGHEKQHSVVNTPNTVSPKREEWTGIFV